MNTMERGIMLSVATPDDKHVRPAIKSMANIGQTAPSISKDLMAFFSRFITTMARIQSTADVQYVTKLMLELIEKK